MDFVEEALRGLITSGPLALALGLCLYFVWKRLMERESELDKVRDEQTEFLQQLLGELRRKNKNGAERSA